MVANLIQHDFSGKIVLITGGTGAVGSRLLNFFSSHGATTIGTYRDEMSIDITLSKSEGIDLFDAIPWRMPKWLLSLIQSPRNTVE